MAAKRAQKAAQVSGREQRPPPGKPFEKGKSGNPGGQPKWVRELRDLLQDDAHRAREVLREVLDDASADPQHRIQAASVVLRYTVPTPKQELKIEGSERTGLSVEELRAIATMAIK